MPVMADRVIERTGSSEGMARKSGRKVVLLPGEGVGPEVTAAARRVVEASGADIEWDVHEVGMEAFRRGGAAVPDHVISAIGECGVALKGPLTTPGPSGPYRSPNVSMRAPLGLYVQVRPVRGWKGVQSATPDANVTVVRSLVEDLSAGIEYAPESEAVSQLRDVIFRHSGRQLAPTTAIGIKPISFEASLRACTFAFRYARTSGLGRVTAAHKATVQRHTDGLFLAAAREAAESHPDVEFGDQLVDALCAEMVRRPTRHSVVVAPALYGDILSDLAAALTGGLGLAGGGNFGDDVAVFEPVHGTVPRRAGSDSVNPIATILSAVMLLRHVAENAAADRIESAVADVLAESDELTYDVAPDRHHRTVGTSRMTDLIVERLT